jgi:eukaryotic-like serine/threonine-protein kinase
MAVIDSKYEILAQESLGDGQTLFDAVAPDGTALRVIWFEFATPQQEMQFETYRQVLRKLEKQDLAAIFDIVSRPGAHYVAWYVPSNGTTKASPELEILLNSYGYDLHNADIRADRGKAVLYGLTFNKPLPEVKAQAILEDLEKPPVRYTVPRWLSVRWLLSWTLGLALSGAGLGLWLVGFLLSANDTIITIPDMRGQNVNEASQRLHDLRLAVTVIPTASSEAPGTVVSSEPSAGNALRPGRTVQLSYALPAGQVALTTVPQLRGETMNGDIQTTLKQANLRLGEVAYIHANVPTGVIISQTQAANAQVTENTAVGILVSSGPQGEQTFIPNLTGLKLEDAQYFINLAGLPVPTVDRVATSRYPADTVLQQSITANTLTSKQDTVLRLLVAGTETASLETTGVPSLVGLSLEEAKRLAPGYTLTVQEITTLNLPKGIVDQTPPPGTENNSAEGNTITVTLNVQPEPIPQPTVTVEIREPRLRQVSYNFYVEPGIANSEVQITAATLQGDFTILKGTISGGKPLTGAWQTIIPGPITFTLTLNGVFYDEQQQNP